jgi:hypothetical protein
VYAPPAQFSAGERAGACGRLPPARATVDVISSGRTLHTTHLRPLGGSSGEDDRSYARALCLDSSDGDATTELRTSLQKELTSAEFVGAIQPGQFTACDAAEQVCAGGPREATLIFSSHAVSAALGASADLASVPCDAWDALWNTSATAASSTFCDAYPPSAESMGVERVCGTRPQLAAAELVFARAEYTHRT